MTADVRPVIIATDDEPERLDRIARTLSSRYSGHYQVVLEPNPASALDRLSEWQASGVAVALIIADLQMGDSTGPEFLAKAREVAPTAQRLLVDEWADFAANEQVVRSSVLGEFDSFTLRPFSEADEVFHAAITECLARWTREQGRWGTGLALIGDTWDVVTVRLRDAFARLGLPFEFHDPASPEGRMRLAGTAGDGLLPAVVLPDGRILSRPSPADIAEALGAPTTPIGGRADVAILGSGPAGLAAAVYAASEGLRAVVVEPISVGGQASSSPMVRNYLGFPAGVTGAELAARAFQQAWTFGAQFLLGRTAVGLRVAGDDRVVTLEDGSEIHAGAVIVATGVAYRRMAVDRLDELVGRGVFYGSGTSEALAVAGGSVFVVGGANSAGSAALHLARRAATVTLLVRGNSLVDTMSDYLIRAIATASNVDVRLGTEIVGVEGSHRLTGLILRDRATGATESTPATAAFILIGAEPRTAWLPEEIARDEHGFILTGDDRPKAHDRWSLATTMPGVFAVGDVRQGPVKRVAAAVGDGSTAVRQVHEYRASIDARDAPETHAATTRARP